MKRRVALHLAFWLAYWFTFAYTYSRYDGNLSKYLFTEGLQMPARMLATYAAMWCFERFNSPVPKHHWLAFGGAALAVFSGGLLNRALKFTYLVPVHFPESSIEFWSVRMMYDLFDVLLACGTALSIRLFFRQQEFQKREAALRSEKLDAELQALKNKIHPHFLFNTINNLYALARKKSDKTAPVALKLAHLLRYVLYESAKPHVRLEQEVQLLQDYIELEKLRFDEGRLSVKMHLDLDDPNQIIAPLLLLPLVENAFKHGVSEKRDAALVNISISLKDKIVAVIIENSKAKEADKNAEGMGLKILSRQLDLLYPDRYELQRISDASTYRVHLRIEL